MTIVHVTPAYPPALGGLEKVVKILALAQLRTGKNVRVITSDRGNNGQADDGQIAVTRLKGVRIANTTITPSLFFHLLRLKRTDMVHVHFAGAYQPELVWLAAKIKGFSYVMHLHIDIGPTGRAAFLLKIYKPLVLTYVLRGALTTVVFTKEQRQSIISQYGTEPARVTVIPNGVEDTFYGKTPRIMHAKPRLLFVGRLEIQKNLVQLLHALAGVSHRFETTIVGSGSLLAEYQKLARELSLQNITFAGRADGEDLMRYYHEADIFVLPSEREGMPLVLLEAMAMGMPIVVTDVTGNRDVVEHGKNGLLVALGNDSAFRDALISIEQNPQTYKAMSTQAGIMARRYSWHEVEAAFSNVYRTRK